MPNSKFVSRIEQCYQQLSPNGRKIANYLQQNPMEVLTLSVAEIAEITLTSKATVSRFFRQLGYANHQDVKEELRNVRHSGYPLTLQHSDNDYVTQELERIRQTWDNVKPEDIEELVQSILKASRITLIGFRNSYPVALHFRQQLLQIRGKVRLLPLPGQTLGEEMEDIADDELVILVAFRRRPKVVQQLIKYLPSSQLVLMADPSAQLYRDDVKQLFICQLGQELPLDSYSAPMSVISVICNQILNFTKQSGNHRIQAISAIYKQLDELE
ncbi:MurR/RpiR family transcriptional regulator [Aliiglaciecola sp. LCG003]|uniref:MurR/RpiR family transcriptional regulator n=1 Tax=Aliiglaciecola sp. LCG003 TaxID=3053655 RepID=UPI0025746AD2|nr:MurR/RpiR family transcriptional regulator [Aliiglaciecola sp. LCG003]WJG07592.1 MurR/RpiR family transcriptional regulator [Aliiglaciecola sp. LCG003]